MNCSWATKLFIYTQSKMGIIGKVLKVGDLTAPLCTGAGWQLQHSNCGRTSLVMLWVCYRHPTGWWRSDPHFLWIRGWIDFLPLLEQWRVYPQKNSHYCHQNPMLTINIYSLLHSVILLNMKLNRHTALSGTACNSLSMLLYVPRTQTSLYFR